MVMVVVGRPEISAVLLSIVVAPFVSVFATMIRVERSTKRGTQSACVTSQE